MKQTPIYDIFYNLFGYYNSEIKNYWDKNYVINKEIKEIKFNDDFDVELNKYLLEIISECEVLTFGKKFDSRIYNLPNSLIKIKFGDYVTNKIKLPNSVKILDLSETKLHYGITKIPNSVVKIKLDTIDKIFLGIIPKTLRILIINWCIRKINIFPDNLEELEILHGYNFAVDNLPCKLKKIRLSDDFNQSLDYLPESLEEIFLGNDFNQSIDNLPRGLIKIIIGTTTSSKFNKSIDNLSNNVKYIAIYNYKYDIQINKIPENLKHFVIQKNVNLNVIENKLKNVKFHNVYY